jgi:hypothetical protein
MANVVTGTSGVVVSISADITAMQTVPTSGSNGAQFQIQNTYRMFKGAINAIPSGTLPMVLLDVQDIATTGVTMSSSGTNIIIQVNPGQTGSTQWYSVVQSKCIGL